jgi:chromosomal replication initiation ATPase DnaA
MGEEDFLVTPSNADAAAMIKEPGTLLLLGPKGSGKSHLARIWKTRNSADVIDFSALAPAALGNKKALVWEDADQTDWNSASEARAFHLLNSAKENKITLLITASAAPAQWSLSLPDLRSRLLALPVAQLNAPDDALMAGLLLKHLNDRQLRVTEDVMDYLLARLPREGSKIAEAVKLLDEASLAHARAITVPLARDILKF